MEESNNSVYGFWWGLGYSVIDAATLCLTKFMFMLTPIPTIQFMFLRSLSVMAFLFVIYKFILGINPLEMNPRYMPYVLVRSFSASIGIGL
jgi:hypothetical protein